MKDVRLRTWVVPVVVVLMFLAGAVNAFAQGATGTITGTVVDTSGAALPGATVTMTETNTLAVRTGVSNESGLFRMAALDPGEYTVRVEMPSFKPVSISAVRLSTNEIRALGKVSLSIGSIEQTVDVTAEATPVQVSDSARRKTVTGDDLKNIQMK